MGNATLLDGILQSFCYGFLPHHFFKALRPPFARQNLIAHGQPDCKDPRLHQLVGSTGRHSMFKMARSREICGTRADPLNAASFRT